MQNLYNMHANEYELMFDEAIKVLPMTLDYDNVKLLARYRDDILVTSLYDATLASNMQFNKQLQAGASKKDKRTYGNADSHMQIKQIGNLFDRDILGRVVNFDIYGLCHYCKQLKLKTEMVKCCFRSNKSLIQSGSKSINNPCNYKGMVFVCFLEQ